MAVVDVVSCETKDGILCERYPKDDIRLGSQLVVYPSQVAVFVKGGAICDQFQSGTHTIKSENIPILNNVINIPFGKTSPFKADVWFVSLVSKLNLPWGTPQPILIEDPEYKIIVPVRSYGQYGIKVTDPKKFLETLIGSMSSFSSEQIDQFFKGKLLSHLNNLLAKHIIEEQCPILNIATHLISLSKKCEEQLNECFAKYGISIVEFSIISINVPENDPSVIRLKSAKDTNARLYVNGLDVYQMERSYDIMEKAAGNGSGVAGAGAGLGVGMAMGGIVSNMSGGLINTNIETPPPLPKEKTYHVVIDDKQVSGKTAKQILKYLQDGKANADTLVWTKGMSDWESISNVEELKSLLEDVPPALPKRKK